jgi:hypothetical protein
MQYLCIIFLKKYAKKLQTCPRAQKKTMAKIVKFEFCLAIGYQGCSIEEQFELKFDDDATDEEIEAQAFDVYQEWVAEKNRGYFSRLD